MCEHLAMSQKRSKYKYQRRIIRMSKLPFKKKPSGLRTGLTLSSLQSNGCETGTQGQPTMNPSGCESVDAGGSRRESFRPGTWGDKNLHWHRSFSNPIRRAHLGRQECGGETHDIFGRTAPPPLATYQPPPLCQLPGEGEEVKSMIQRRGDT